MKPGLYKRKITGFITVRGSYRINQGTIILLIKEINNNNWQILLPDGTLALVFIPEIFWEKV